MILGIVGSYRRGGTIDQAVSSVLAAARVSGAETKKVYLRDFDIRFCTNCRLCTQAPGSSPGRCHLKDDMLQLIMAIEGADAYVFGAPVNAGSANALTQRFIERLICFSYWPWEQKAPRLRKSEGPSKKAVLITSCAMPAIMGRFFTGSLRSLKLGAKMIGGKPVATIFIGSSAVCEKQDLPKGMLRKTRRAVEKLCRS